MQEAIPWYKSRIIIGVVVSLVCKALVVSGVTGDITDEGKIVDAVLMVAGGLGDLWALYSRVKQTNAPVIAATASKAIEIHKEIKEIKAVARDAADLALDAEVPSWMRPR